MKRKKLRWLLLAAVAFSVPFAAGSAHAAADLTAASVSLDKTYLERAVVSTVPVKLSADVRNAARQRIWDAEVRYTVTAGENVAEIQDGNLLIVKAAGKFTVKTEVAETPSVSEEFSGEAFDVTFSNVEFNNKFENVTVYTQPMKLTGNIEVVGIAAPGICHYELTFRVVSGPAEIYCEDFLRITGTGEVTVEAASRYNPEVKTTRSFTVTDPDEGKLADPDAEYKQAEITGGCSSKSASASAILLSALTLGGIFLGKRR